MMKDVRKTKEQSLKEAIDNMLHAYKLQGKIYEVQLVDKWETIVGKPIANHTLQLYLKGKKLCLKLDSDGMKNELVYAKTTLIGRINYELGTDIIEDIVFL